MKGRTLFNILVLLCFSSLVGQSFGSVFYVDASSGSDSNSGQTEAEAWKSIARVNGVLFSPGDQILFKRDREYQGMLSLRGEGSKGEPIRVGEYGDGELPVIRFGKKDRCGIYLKNQSYVTIEGIRVIGSGKGKRGKNYAGILSEIDRSGLVCEGIVIRGCVVSDVGGEEKGSDKSTGLISLVAKAPGAFYRDILVEGCEVFSTKQWAGIVIAVSDWERVKNQNIIFRNCIASDVYGDGIVQFSVQDSLIDNCVAYDVGLDPVQDVGTPNGIWHWDSINSVVQYCEVYRVKSPGIDGGAFDIDWANLDCVVQDSYGHDCDGYGVAVFATRNDVRPTSGTVIRNNLFVNNGREWGVNGSGQGDFAVMTWEKGRIGGLRIYNNTSLWNPAGDDPAILFKDATFVGSAERSFERNLVVAKNRKLVALLTDGISFDHNVYWSRQELPYFWKSGEGADNLESWAKQTGYDTNSICGDPRAFKKERWPESNGAKGKGDAFALLQRYPISLPGAGIQFENETVYKPKAGERFLIPTEKAKGSSSGRTLLLVGCFSCESDRAVASENDLVYLKSLVNQYGSSLRFVVADACRAVCGAELTEVGFENTYFAKNLPAEVDFIPFETLQAETVERHEVPALYLLDGQGRVVDRLAGRLHPGLLAQRVALSLAQ